MEHKQVENLGYKVNNQRTHFDFEYNGHKVIFWKKKQWFSGRSVKDGRGIHNLISQINKEDIETEYFDLAKKEAYNHLIGIFQRYSEVKVTDSQKELMTKHMKRNFKITLTK